MSESVRLRVQFRVGQRSLCVHDSASVRTLAYLFLEQLVNTRLTRVCSLGSIPLHQHPLPFLGRKHIQGTSQGLRLTLQCLHQCRQCSMHQLADSLWINACFVLGCLRLLFSLFF